VRGKYYALLKRGGKQFRKSLQKPAPYTWVRSSAN